MASRKNLSLLPSVDAILRSAGAVRLIEDYGRDHVVDIVRECVDEARRDLIASDLGPAAGDIDEMVRRAGDRLCRLHAPTLRPVLNLTGTVLHTNLGRAPLPEAALHAIAAVSGGASNLEFDLASGKRGDRDNHVAEWLCRLTGGEAATVVNNNAAAVMLCLNSLALRKQVIVSRGELVEIGGSFRIPDVMARAGSKLVEVGTTNRTHAGDYEEAVTSRTGLIMRVHTSNYEVRGFTASVPEPKLAQISRRADVPFLVDLGSGALVDLSRFGLPKEPTVRETLAQGADVVTFSGDKLLGGPQAGVIVGRADLIKRIKKNPMKRALRVDKMTIAALSALLPTYSNLDRLVAKSPTLSLLARPAADVAQMAQALSPRLANILAPRFTVEAVPCQSQIGSGAQPTKLLDSFALKITPAEKKRGGRLLQGLARDLRQAGRPVIGRIEDGALWFDLRCLENAEELIGAFSRLPFS